MKYKVGDEFVIRIGEKYNTTGVVNAGSEITNKPNCLYRIEGFNALTFDENGLDKLDRLDDDYINEHSQDAVYQKGLEDAWEIAKKVIFIESNGGISIDDLKKIFGYRKCSEILENFTASEALEKIREYEKKQDEIKVGDEIIFGADGDRRGIVLEIKNPEKDRFKILEIKSGSFISTEGYYTLTRTGRHFSQIAEVLEQMKEEAE